MLAPGPKAPGLCPTLVSTWLVVTGLGPLVWELHGQLLFFVQASRALRASLLPTNPTSLPGPWPPLALTPCGRTFVFSSLLPELRT